ncbi:ADP-ribosylation factor family-domain-containing protein [Fimicolochytrium jonesii]|uniref:ADP-ribosylation factor family-domain-containing protein n=1 Tax=Fimicolochytrium jonesii TaxID=1396493 RepID=UPI0022FE0B0B|nr:ADP-ribosylation factor family-domain-containing protein [Fimicolochytrium jonesii]KAI8817039.1 ADP-ribosylation factor family-domain-containing protein [Fimicolochytrium jonesii]
MGLLTVLKKLKQKEKEIRILILGLDNAGKTTILKRITGESISGVSPTLGFNIKTVAFRGYKLNIWDIGGQKSIRSYWRNYFEQTDAVVWVVDSADRVERFEGCREELGGVLGEERLAGATLLIYANKQDIPGALTPTAIADLLDLQSIKTHHWEIVACSAVTGKGVGEGLEWVVADVGGRIYMLD